MAGTFLKLYNTRTLPTNIRWHQVPIGFQCLPSNTTHELLPMNKAVFCSFEHFQDENFGQDTRIVSSHHEFFLQCGTPSNIKAGFSATGIFPFNSEVLPPEAYAPSITTELNNIEDQVTSSSISQRRQPIGLITPPPGPSNVDDRRHNLGRIIQRMIIFNLKNVKYPSEMCSKHLKWHTKDEGSNKQSRTSCH